MPSKRAGGDVVRLEVVSFCERENTVAIAEFAHPICLSNLGFG